MITDQLLGLLKVVLLLALYLFFARVLWAVWHEIRTPAVSRVAINKTGNNVGNTVGEAAASIDRPHVSREHRVSVLRIISPAELKGTDVALGDAEVLVGRGPDCTLRLAAETGASVRHARISNVDGYVTIEDLGSTNRTMVNGNVIDSPTRLRVGDRVYIGLVTLEARR